MTIKYDVAVVGGGVNGTSVTARLAENGFEVILIERDDFGSGSSSRSSRLMHCGLNYLASARETKGLLNRISNLILAREMMTERAHLSRQLQGRLLPRTFVIPIRESDPVPPWQYDLAFRVLRLMGGRQAPLNYRRYSGKRYSEHLLSRFFADDVIGLAAFDEMIFEWPERICVDYAMKAQAHGATILNHTRLLGAEYLNDYWRLSLSRSSESANVSEVRAKALVNMTGIWSDEVNASCSIGNQKLSISNPTVQANKGCHLMVKLPPEFADIGIISRNSIGHLFLSVPWRGHHILGPTESVVDLGTTSARVEESDVSKILADANAVIPHANLGREHIVRRWAGLRPATYALGNARGTWKRRIYRDDPGPHKPFVISMSWGRLADHRISTTTIVSDVEAYLGRRKDRKLSAGIADKHVLADHVADLEGAEAVADIMFGRTGWGWDPDFGLSHLTAVAEMLAFRHPTASVDELKGDYLMLLRDQFHFDAPSAVSV